MDPELYEMISLVVKQLVFQDEFGKRWVLTGFKDRHTALLSRQDGSPSMPMECSRLDGLRCIGTVHSSEKNITQPMTRPPKDPYWNGLLSMALAAIAAILTILVRDLLSR